MSTLLRRVKRTRTLDFLKVLTVKEVGEVEKAIIHKIKGFFKINVYIEQKGLS